MCEKSWKFLNENFRNSKITLPISIFKDTSFLKSKFFFWKFMNFQLIHDRPRYQTWKCIGPPELVHFWMLLEES